MVDVIESCNFVMYVVRVRSVMMQQQQLYSSSVENSDTQCITTGIWQTGKHLSGWKVYDWKMAQNELLYFPLLMENTAVLHQGCHFPVSRSVPRCCCC